MNPSEAEKVECRIKERKEEDHTRKLLLAHYVRTVSNISKGFNVLTEWILNLKGGGRETLLKKLWTAEERIRNRNPERIRGYMPKCSARLEKPSRRLLARKGRERGQESYRWGEGKDINKECSGGRGTSGKGGGRGGGVRTLLWVHHDSFSL